jgi:phosphopantetheine--protein transferase-like protein
MIGVDLVEISRIREIHARDGARFLRHVCSEAEIRLVEAKGLENQMANFLAGRWAAKEAVIKILKRDAVFGAKLADISILQNDAGAPVVALTGHAQTLARELGFKTIHVSISHSESHAVAIAMGERA